MSLDLKKSDDKSNYCQISDVMAQFIFDLRIFRPDRGTNRDPTVAKSYPLYLKILPLQLQATLVSSNLRGPSFL